MLNKDLFIRELSNLDEFADVDTVCQKVLKTFEKWAGKLDISYMNTPKGVHGIGHAHRVLFLSILLSELHGLSDEDKKLLYTCAIFHDIGRINQDFDAIHGELSYRKMHDLLLLPPDLFHRENDMILKYIMENHCRSDKKIYDLASDYGINDSQRAVFLLRFFKDCDGLDRVRLGDLDIDYLRNEKSKKLVDIAYLLLLNTTPP